MYRAIMFAGWLLALIMTSISQVSAFDLEGGVVQGGARGQSIPVRMPEPRDPVAAEVSEVRHLPEKWDCDTSETEVRIRRVTLCRANIGGRVPGPVEKLGVIRYRVLVEKGLEVQAAAFAQRVDKILGLNSGWAGHGHKDGLRFVRFDEKYDMTVLLAQPTSVDRLCRPLSTRGALSCAIGRNAVINSRRWLEGAETWGNNIRGYHHYLVNHEVGHVLGLRHIGCPEEGLLAPIMLQQTIFLKGCLANGEATPGDLAMLSRIMPRIRRRFDGFEPEKRTQRQTRRRSRSRTRRRSRSRARRLSRGTPRRRSRSRRR
jgi:hypothetical protein